MPLQPKVCVECEREFQPNSGVQKRCADCRGSFSKPIAPQRDPTRIIEEPKKPKRQANVERIRNTELGLRLAERCRTIEEESYARFREEKEHDGDV